LLKIILPCSFTVDSICGTPTCELDFSSAILDCIFFVLSCVLVSQAGI
jgi:hypothetical protein